MDNINSALGELDLDSLITYINSQTTTYGKGLVLTDVTATIRNGGSLPENSIFMPAAEMLNLPPNLPREKFCSILDNARAPVCCKVGAIIYIYAYDFRTGSFVLDKSHARREEETSELHV